MAQKSEAPALVLAFLLTVGLVGAGVWWLTQKTGVNLSNILSPGANSTNGSNSPNSSPNASGFAEIQSVPSGLFNYGGSTTWAPIRRDVDTAIQATFPRFSLRYTDPIGATPGSSVGIQMLLDGQLAFTQSSRPLEDKEYQQAQQRGFSLKQIPVAIEGIAIAVHPNLPIAGLNLEQLRGIYTGKITNWNQLGGPTLRITPYSRRTQDSGTVEFFITHILNRKPLHKTVQPVYSTTDALRKVSNNMGGIYYASAPEVVPQCSIKPLPLARAGNNFVPPYQEPLVSPERCPSERNQLNSSVFKSGQYPLTRQLFVVIKQNDQIEQQAGETYAAMLLTNQGQELISQANFVRIR